MSLIEFNAKNSFLKREAIPPALGISTKRGEFCFTRSAAKMLKLTGAEGVKLLKDPDHPENWYLEIVQANGFNTRKNKRTGFIYFNNAAAARDIFETVHYTESYGSVLIAGQPTIKGRRILYGLIISRLKSI